MDDIERFFAKVEEDAETGCWEWIACRTENGYGRFRLDGTMRYAHRVMWVWAGGELKDGEEINHRCNNRACVNPDHLETLPHDKNMAYMVAQGRQAHPYGETNGRAKLTQAQVDEIRTRYNVGDVSQRELAREYGVVQQTISKIVNNLKWRCE